MLGTLLTRAVRGQALSELQIAIWIGAIVLAGFAFLFARNVAASSAMNTYAANEAAVVSFFKEAEDGAAAGQAVFSPAEDVGGNSNADGHAADYYQQDASHVGHFYEVCFKASSGVCQASQAVGTMQRYAYLWRDLPQNGGSGATAQSSPITLFSGFTFRVLNTAAQYADPTLNPYAYAYFAKHPANFASARTFHFGYPGVTASTNDLYVMTVTLPNGEKRSIAFGKHNIVFAQDAIYGTATPTPNPMCAGSCPQTSVSLTYRNPIDASQNATLLENNYGTRSTNPAQVYTVSGCSGTATFSPGSPVTPASDGSGSATLTITPVKQVAPGGLTCGITATDNANQSIPIGVVIGRTYSPTSSGPAAGLSGQNGTFTVSEGNYNTSPSGGFNASISGACNSITRTGASLNASYTETETWSVHFASTGVCGVTFTDTYGQTVSGSTNVSCSSYGTPCGLTVSPTSMTIYVPPSGPGQPTSGNVSVSESNQYNLFTITNGCNGYANVSPTSLASSGGSFTVSATYQTPIGSPCKVTVSDSNGQSGSVSVTVDPMPATPTPSPTATPTAAPTPSNTACAAANSCYVVLVMGVVCGDQYCSSGIVYNGYEGTMMDSTFTQTPNSSTSGWASFNDSGSPANHFAIDTTYCNGGQTCGSAPSQLQTCYNNLLNGMVNANSPNPVETWQIYIYAGHLTNSSTSTRVDYNSSTYNLNNLWAFNGFAGAEWYETKC